MVVEKLIKLKKHLMALASDNHIVFIDVTGLDG